MRDLIYAGIAFVVVWLIFESRQSTAVAAGAIVSPGTQANAPASALVSPGFLGGVGTLVSPVHVPAAPSQAPAALSSCAACGGSGSLATAATAVPTVGLSAVGSPLPLHASILPTTGTFNAPTRPVYAAPIFRAGQPIIAKVPSVTVAKPTPTQVPSRMLPNAVKPVPAVKVAVGTKVTTTSVLAHPASYETINRSYKLSPGATLNQN